MRKYAPRAGKRWTAEVFAALDEQTVVVSGTNAAGIVLPQLARSLVQTRTARTEVLAQVELLVEAHPLHILLTSLPAVCRQDRGQDPHRGRWQGLPDRRTPHLLGRAGPGHVALWYLDPRGPLFAQGQQGPQTGSVSISVRLAARPISRTYYDRNRAERKKHNQAVIALARRRCNVLPIILRSDRVVVDEVELLRVGTEAVVEPFRLAEVA